MGEVFPLRITRLYRRITGLSKLIPSRLKQIKKIVNQILQLLLLLLLYLLL